MRLLANTAAMAELPEALAVFLAGHPSVDIDLDERPSTDVARAVAEDLADAGAAADHADLAGLERRLFRIDRLVLIVPPGYALSGGGQVAFADALDGEFIGLAGDSALQRHLAGHAARAGKRMRLRARVRGLDAVCRMVALGAGIAVVAEAAARRFGHDDAMGVATLGDTWAVRGLLVIVRRLDALPAHARRLVEHLSAPADSQQPNGGTDRIMGTRPGNTS